ncbi:hypothetical protein Tco_0189604 [Tanacetum coccineum]|uniref:Uncharacterized protein n=1 Tax=Tanacetum coccineum TaxID=301880 RepID=A0ABQ5FMU5_9ASTR
MCRAGVAYVGRLGWGVWGEVDGWGHDDLGNVRGAGWWEGVMWVLLVVCDDGWGGGLWGGLWGCTGGEGGAVDARWVVNPRGRGRWDGGMNGAKGMGWGGGEVVGVEWEVGVVWGVHGVGVGVGWLGGAMAMGVVVVMGSLVGRGFGGSERGRGVGGREGADGVGCVGVGWDELGESGWVSGGCYMVGLGMEDGGRGEGGGGDEWEGGGGVELFGGGVGMGGVGEVEGAIGGVWWEGGSVGVLDVVVCCSGCVWVAGVGVCGMGGCDMVVLVWVRWDGEIGGGWGGVVYGEGGDGGVVRWGSRGATCGWGWVGCAMGECDDSEWGCGVSLWMGNVVGGGGEVVGRSWVVGGDGCGGGGGWGGVVGGEGLWMLGWGGGWGATDLEYEGDGSGVGGMGGEEGYGRGGWRSKLGGDGECRWGAWWGWCWWMGELWGGGIGAKWVGGHGESCGGWGCEGGGGGVMVSIGRMVEAGGEWEGGCIGLWRFGGGDRNECGVRGLGGWVVRAWRGGGNGGCVDGWGVRGGLVVELRWDVVVVGGCDGVGGDDVLEGGEAVIGWGRWVECLVWVMEVAAGWVETALVMGVGEGWGVSDVFLGEVVGDGGIGNDRGVGVGVGGMGQGCVGGDGGDVVGGWGGMGGGMVMMMGEVVLGGGGGYGGEVWWCGGCVCGVGGGCGAGDELWGWVLGVGEECGGVGLGWGRWWGGVGCGGVAELRGCGGWADVGCGNLWLGCMLWWGRRDVGVGLIVEGVCGLDDVCERWGVGGWDWGGGFMLSVESGGEVVCVAGE